MYDAGWDHVRIAVGTTGKDLRGFARIVLDGFDDYSVDGGSVEGLSVDPPVEGGLADHFMKANSAALRCKSIDQMTDQEIIESGMLDDPYTSEEDHWEGSSAKDMQGRPAGCPDRNIQMQLDTLLNGLNRAGHHHSVNEIRRDDTIPASFFRT